MKSQIFSCTLYFVFTVVEAKYAIVRPENKIFYEDNKSHSENEDLAETLPKLSKTVQGLSHPDFPSPESLVKPPFMPLTVAGLAKVSCFKFFPHSFSYTIPLILVMKRILERNGGPEDRNRK